jgi:hypothetical protein
MPAVKTQETTYKQRCYLQALRHAGWTFARIARDQNLGITTVQRICSQPVTTHRKRTGQPPKIDTPTRRRLVFTAILNAENRLKTYKDIAEICGINANERTLRNTFEKEGYHCRIARKKVFLKAEYKQRRLEFTLAHQHWTIHDWRCVIWTDGYYVWLGGARGNIWVTRRPSEEYEEDCITPKFKKQNSVMIWGGILGGKKTPLVLWDRRNWDTITALTYIHLSWID